LISLVVAAADNDVIGRDGGLPWRLPADLRHFRELTMGKPIVMGRLTWESIGRPLPGRQNIVMTRQSAYAAEGADVVATAEEAVAAAGGADEIMVIGGAQVYAEFLPRAGRIYLTRVHAEPAGDVRFPPVDEAEWRETSRDVHGADAEHEYAFSFLVLERR
jgi:dihydrofolate reductase